MYWQSWISSRRLFLVVLVVLFGALNAKADTERSDNVEVEFTLKSTDGLFHFKDLRGKVVLLFFDSRLVRTFAHCHWRKLALAFLR